jgi:hypothetical protein
MSRTEDLARLLKKLRLSGVLVTLELRVRQMADENLDAEEFLYRLLCDEAERREAKLLPISEIRGESIVAQASALPRASRRGGGDDAQKSHGTRGSEGWIGRGRGGRRALL